MFSVLIGELSLIHDVGLILILEGFPVANETMCLIHGVNPMKAILEVGFEGMV